ncbi:McrB family protein [Pseudobutyrivibrio ruminis]|uniref:AAA domain (Dynein-related subfamily) n=1 Tax=Pseudobutyrivibrio ruminis DSM 9787 TaxID=1123011 RepID=A0A285T8H2_9FIRM|nr:AAA family ATPase [Pseudobutyrivibrio ruminis]SOC17813.1 AAA domain (dynein-related subfamily) [Pseudobutyrivibrio ruminis DSM 9787]
MNKFFALRISDPTSSGVVNKLKNSDEDITISQIYQFKDELTVGTYLFIQLGGDKVSWDKGLIGLASITKGPHNEGYDKSDPKYFEIDVKMILRLNNAIKRSDFVYYPNAYDAGGIGPNTKGEPNQPIKSLNTKHAYTLLRAMADRQIDIADTIHNIFDEDVCAEIFGDIPMFFEKSISYDDFQTNKLADISTYKEASLEQRRKYFQEWMVHQIRPDTGKHYTTKTAGNYASSLANDASKLEMLNIENTNLFHYIIYAEFKDIKAIIESCPNYKEVDEKNNNTFRNAILKYSEYLDSFSVKQEKKTCVDIKLSPRNTKRYPLNFILYGAPGTGKTYSTPEYAVAIIEDIAIEELGDYDDTLKKYETYLKHDQIVFTTFHQNYSYEEFIQGLRPDVDSDTLAFIPVDGCFKMIADDALSHPEQRYVFIIDEINRANISKVFGELITLIEEDKRWGEKYQMCVKLPENNELFTIPNNLYIVGTMNTADKSISLIDVALRRRFDFIELTPDLDLIHDEVIKDVLYNLNKYLEEQLKSSDLLVGHSFFIDKTEEDLPRIFNNSIIPLLYEYFYDQKSKVKKALEESLKVLDDKVTIIDKKMGRLKIELKDDNK